MIALSAGHYPKDPGACWPKDKPTFCEHEIAVEWIGLIALTVRQQIPLVVIPSGWLGDKVKAINALKNCKLAVELHFNSSSSISARGSETLYCPGSKNGLQAAITMQKYMSNIFPPNRGAKEGWYRMDRPGHIDYKSDIEGDEKIDYFLGKTKPVALIIEPEFIFNSMTIKKLRLPGCDAIASGILAAYKELP